ncbi:hypothetical protein L2712_18790 [Shewanella marisflavi]|uniref:hypothetical protein n=1 Tax=Shewanella marisflavi TaxID=260364 RepID=UPI00200CAB80|nr:hypothetical protein [Shewanella marisflavi]MCL1043678.1 hypothetical protein [Shewanella marisflavi]
MFYKFPEKFAHEFSNEHVILQHKSLGVGKLLGFKARQNGTGLLFDVQFDEVKTFDLNDFCKYFDEVYFPRQQESKYIKFLGAISLYEDHKLHTLYDFVQSPVSWSESPLLH